MCKRALAILLLVVAFVGAEEEAASQASSTPTAGAGQTNGGQDVPKAGTGQTSGGQDVPKAGTGQTSGGQGVSKAGTAQTSGGQDVSKADTAQTSGGQDVSKAGTAQTSGGQDVSKADSEQTSGGKDVPIAGTEEPTEHSQIVKYNDVQAHIQAPEEEEDAPLTSEETTVLKEDETGRQGDHWTVSTRCMDCLCLVVGGCGFTSIEKGCHGQSCGPFGMIYEFWEDAFDYKQPEGPSYKEDAIMRNKWRLCADDLLCATKAIRHYINKYPVDCNEDGKVDCIDYAAIHTLGPFGCKNKSNLRDWNRNVRREMLQCLVKREEGVYTKTMRELEEKLKLQDIAGRLKAEKENKKSTVEDKTGTENDKSKTTAETDTQKLTRENTPKETAV